MTKDELIELAKENDVSFEYSQRKAEIEAALVEAGVIEEDAGGPKTVPILLKRDAWDQDGDRQPAGTVADFEIAIAKQLIAAGAAERADPMPGE